MTIKLFLSTARMSARVTPENFARWGKFVKCNVASALSLPIKRVLQHRWGFGDEDTIENATPDQEEAIRSWLRGDGWRTFLAAERKLTSREEKALAAVRAFAQKMGYPPTIRELGERLEVSRRRAHQLLQSLRAKGAIEWDTGRARGIRVVSHQEAPARTSAETLKAALHALPFVNVTTERGTQAHVALADVEALLEQ